MTFQNQHDHDQKRKNLSDVEPGISLAPPAFNPTASGEEENPQAHESTESANYVRDTPPGEIPPPNPHSFYDFSLFLRNLSASNLQHPLDTKKLPQTNFDLMQTHEKRPNQSLSHNKHNAQDSGGKYGSRTPQSQQFRENLGIPEDMSTGEFIAQNRSTGSSLSQRDAQAMVNAKFQRDKEAKIQAKRDGNSQESQESESQQVESPQNQQASPPQTPPDGGTKQEGDYIFMTVPIPAGMSQSEALVRGVMYVLNVSRSEAENAIEQENIRFNSFNPEGIGTDENGDVLHKIRIPQKYLARTAHEPTQFNQPPEQSIEEIYLPFKKYLASLEANEEKQDALNSNSLESLFDMWATMNGLHPIFSPNRTGSDVLGLNPIPLAIYTHQREEVLKLITFDRLRSQREGLTAQNPKMKSHSLTEYLYELEIELLKNLPQSVKEGGADNEFLPIAQRWQSIRKKLIPYQVSTNEEGIPDELVAELLTIAQDFQQLASQYPLAAHSDQNEQGSWTITDVVMVQNLMKLGDARTKVDNQRVISQSLQMGLSIFQYLGQQGSHSEKPFDQMTDAEKQSQLEHGRIASIGERGQKTFDLLQKHENVRSVEATFYPDQHIQQMRMSDPNAAPNTGQPLVMFTWYDQKTGEWVLEDFTDQEDKKENRVKGEPGAPVPASLFSELNTRLRFPKGAIMYRVPGESTYRMMQTEAKMEWYDWVRMVAMGGVAVGAAFATAGASVPASLLMLTSGTALAVGEAGEMHHKSEVGVLDGGDTVMHIAGIISSLAGGIGAFTKITLKANNLGKSAQALTFAQKAAQGIHYVELSSDGVGLVVYSMEAVETINGMVADGAPPAEIARVVALYFSLGMMQAVSLKGGAREIVDFQVGKKEAGEQGAKAAVNGSEQIEKEVADKVKGKETVDESTNKQTGFEGGLEFDESRGMGIENPSKPKPEMQNQGQFSINHEIPRGLLIDYRVLSQSFKSEAELSAKLKELIDEAGALRKELFGEATPAPRPKLGELAYNDPFLGLGTLSDIFTRELSLLVKGFIKNPQKMVRLVSVKYKKRITEGKLDKETIIQAVTKSRLGKKFPVPEELEAKVSALVDDALMKGYSEEEIARIERYFQNNPDSDLLNYEVNEAYKRNADPEAHNMEVIAPPGNKREGWNKEINKALLPHTVYRVGPFTYYTDELGRVYKATGDLSLIKGDRNLTEQGKAVKLKDGRKGDDAAHIFAAMFKGPGEQINYWPMKGVELNRGKWLDMERICQQKLKNGEDVSVEFKAIFEEDSKRPITFKAVLKITEDGRTTYRDFKFNN